MNRILLLASAIFLWCGTVYATNITIPDLNFSTTSGWYGQQEDQEVEPGMAASQAWDLEGFFVNGTRLSLVGGYDFKNGVSGYTSGDIFIDTTGDVVYGDIDGTSNGNNSVSNSYGYDYVLDLDWSNLTYDVYAIDSNTQVLTAYYSQNQGSSPWQYSSGGMQVSGASGTIEYHTGLTDAQTGFTGGSHNELVVDLAFLLNGQDHADFIAHYTMGCGNDNIMGQGTIPNPEPATFLLLGFGLLGIAGLGRKKLKK